MSCLPSVLRRFRPQCVPNSNTPRQIGRQARRWAPVLLLTAAGYAQSAPPRTFSSAAVGATSPATVTVTAQTGGLVADAEVLTLGTGGLEFAAGGAPTCQGVNLTAGSTCQQSVIFKPAFPGIRMGAVVLKDGNGNVLGSAYLSGLGTGGLGVTTPGNATTVAGVYRTWTSTQDGIAATSANLWQPSSIAFDGAGNMYIADSEHNKIRMVTAADGEIHTIAGTGDAGWCGDGGAAANANLSSPSGVALDGAGNLYVADSGNNRIRKITPDGTITTLAGDGTAGFAGDNYAADTSRTEFDNPLGITVDYAGNLYIADTNNQRIRRIDAATGVITTVAGNGDVSGLNDGKGTFAGDGGPATSAGLSLPYAVALDGAGNMFIPDSANHCIRRVDAATQTITTVAGMGTHLGYSGDGGAATAAKLDEPSGVAVDPAGNLWIADTQNSAIRKVNAATGKIATLVVNGQGNSLSSTGSLSTVQIYAPVGLYLDGSGNLYFADYYYMLIREIQGNAGVLNFTATPVQLGSQSTTPLVQTVENDGNAPLTLTSITNDQNATIDSSTTTCNQYLSAALAIDAQCNIGVFFAPSLQVQIPNGQSKLQVNGNVDAAGNTPNSPLDVIAVGYAAPVNSTTLTLSSSPASPSAYGENVTFKATVQSSSTPSGTVAFTIDGGATVPASINVSSAGNNSAVATYTTAGPLAVGRHAIGAVFTAATGTNYLTSTADPFTQEVDAATATTLTSSSSGAVSLGASLTFTAKVTVANGAGVTPDGTVTFYDGTSAIGTPVAINASGVAIATISSLTAGMHAITAVFSGDPNTYIMGSTSTALNQDVQAGSATALNSSPNPSIYGNSVTFVVTVTSNSGSPATGSVNFLDGTTQIGTVALSGNPGAATFTTSSLTAGSHAITAVYQGDQNNGSSSASIAQAVNLTPTAATTASSPNPGIAGKAVTLAATVKAASGSGTPTGSVTFTDGSTSLGSAKIGSGGTASISQVLAPGAHAIVATYGGDSNDAGSASTPLALQVNLATTSVAVASSASPAVVLAPVTFTATVTGNGAVPTGAITFSVDGVSASTTTLNNGKAAFADSALGVGTHTVTAIYSGDTDDNASTSSAFPETVQAIPTTTSLGTGASSGPAPQTILVATVVAGTGPTPTGTVTFMDGSTQIGLATLDENGVATLVPDLTSTNYNIVASYSGDLVHSPSTSSSVKVSGTPIGFAMTVDPNSVTLATSQNSTINVSLNSNNGYADTIGLGCGTVPMGVTCHFSSNTVDLKAGATASVQLTIDTNNPLGGGATAMNQGVRRGGFSLAALFLPSGLIFGWIGWRFRRRNGVMFGAVLAVLLSGAIMMSGCGGFSQQSAAPGTYTIQVNCVGSNSNVSHYQNITLTITK